MDTFNELGKILKPHAVLTSMGLPSERAMEIVNNRNLTFKHNEGDKLTTPLRETIKTVDKVAYETAEKVLTRCTTDQLLKVMEVAESNEIKFYSVNHIEHDLMLSGIRLTNNGFVLDFNNSSMIEETYHLALLGLDDKLSLIDIIEHVLLNQ